MPSGEVQVWKCWQSWGREGLIHQGPRPVHGSWSRRLCLCFLLGERVAGNEWESTAELERFWSVCPMCQRVSVLAWNAKCGGFQWRGGLLLFKLRLSFDGILSSVQLLSHVQLFATPWTAAHQASLSITNSWSPPKLMSIESVMPSNNLIVYHPLLLLPSIFPSIRVFSNESALRIRWPKNWSFSFKISSTNEHPGLIS